MQVTISGYEPGKKIQVIKAVRALTGLGLKDSKVLVDSIDGIGGHAGDNRLTIGPQTFTTDADPATVRSMLVGYATWTCAALTSMEAAQLAINAVEAWATRPAARAGLRSLMGTLDPTAEPRKSLQAALELL